MFRGSTMLRRLFVGSTGAAAVAIVANERSSFNEQQGPLRTVSNSTVRFERKWLIRCAGRADEMYEHYEIVKQLGKGGFGLVSLAKSKVTGLLRAIKQVNQNAEDQEYVSSRLAEVEALMELDSPNVVKLFEYYGTPACNKIFLVEELCTGGTLESAIAAAGGRFSADYTAVLLRQMLRGVLCCHAHGLAHRDLKPDNFAFATEHKDASLKLLDFGLSLGTSVGPPLQSADAISDEVGAYLRAAGTLERTAPETLPTRNARTGKPQHTAIYGKAADIWSLGAIAFAMLTGEPLIDLAVLEGETAEFRRLTRGGDLLDDLARRVRSEKFIAARIAFARRRCGDARAADLLERMLHIDPAQRVSATDALRHPYIAESFLRNPEANPTSQTDVRKMSAQYLERVRAFADAPALRKLGVLAAAHIVAPQDDLDLRTEYIAFRMADSSGDGALQVEELTGALGRAGVPVPSDLAEMLERCDVNRSGSINLVEFVAATMDPAVYAERRMCRAIFGLLDADRDGRITTTDVEALLDGEPNQRAEQASAILASADAARDAGTGELYVDWAKFEALMR